MDQPEPLGVHFISGEHLKRLLWFVHEGEHPEVVYMQMYAGSEHVTEDELRAEGDEE